MDSNYTHFNDTTHVFKAYLTLYKVTDFIKLLFGTPVAVEPLATANDEPIYVASYNEQLAKRTWGDIKRAFFEFYDGDITKYLDRDNSTILECLHWLIVDDILAIDGRLKTFLANLKIKDEQVASLPFLFTLANFVFNDGHELIFIDSTPATQQQIPTNADYFYEYHQFLSQDVQLAYPAKHTLIYCFNLMKAINNKQYDQASATILDTFDTLLNCIINPKLRSQLSIDIGHALIAKGKNPSVPNQPLILQ